MPPQLQPEQLQNVRWARGIENTKHSSTLLSRITSQTRPHNRYRTSVQPPHKASPPLSPLLISVQKLCNFVTKQKEVS